MPAPRSAHPVNPVHPVQNSAAFHPASLTLLKTVHLQYFALLREQRGLGTETLATSASTTAQLYDELRARHNFSLPSERLRVAVNGEFAPWTTTLTDGAQIVFIPPVAGG